MSRPEVIITPNGPAIFHADFSPVTATNPAKPGEVVIARVSGLGPVRAALEPGEPFPSDPLAVVNSPIDVTVNGGATQVINAVGWPGTTDNYRLDFPIPAGTLAGDARVQIAAAWIAGPEVRIAVR